MCGSGSIFQYGSKSTKLLNTVPIWICIQELWNSEYGSGSTHVNIGIKRGKRCQIRGHIVLIVLKNILLLRKLFFYKIISIFCFTNYSITLDTDSEYRSGSIHINIKIKRCQIR